MGSFRSRGEGDAAPRGGAERGQGVGSEAVREAQRLAEESCSPPVIRHNSCFLHLRGLDDGTGFAPTRPLMAGCRYHDMVRDTIYLAGSRDVRLVGQYLASRPQREAEQMEWSKNRFRKQRETAALWQDMRQTFDEISGRPQGARPATPEAAQLPSGAPQPGLGVGVGAGAARGGSGLGGSVARGIFEELAALGLTQPGSGSGRGGLGGLARTASEPGLATLRGSGSTALRQSVVRQSPGTRGLPRDFTPAVAMHTGVMMFPKDRCFKDQR